MKKRILLVEKAGDTRTQLLAAIGVRCDLFAVSSAEEAIDACRTVGPFAVAVAEEGLPGVSAVDLLRRVHESWPETIGMLITPEADPATARGMREPHVFRCVTRPCDPAALLSAVDAALSRSDEAERAEVLSEELQFREESMESFTALLEERMERQSAALRRLHRFSLELSDAGSTRDIARLAAEAASDVLGGRGAQVQLWEATCGGEDISIGAGREMSTSLHRTPIVTRGGEIGEICVDLFGAREERLSTIETTLLASISSSASIAVHQELARRELDRAQRATTLSLARLAERRDMETGQHLERVAAYCRLVAESMRALGRCRETITDEFIENLVCSSPLHDIGKVGIPDSILLKPGRLTPEEWEIMKTHAEIGGATLDTVVRDFGAPGFLTMGRDIAWCHHEMWDGTGYPRGLKGTSIPLSARIVALADVYDALTTVRPYKGAWPHAEAVEWILSRRGTHFDPDVVDAFAVRLDDADRIRSALADSRIEPEYAARELAVRL